jgi:hypothetical protein
MPDFAGAPQRASSHRRLPHGCPAGLAALQRLRRRPRLVTAFWKQADLFE